MIAPGPARLMALAWAVAITAVLGAGCSLDTVRRDRSRCTSDSQCEEVFGEGATCGGGGYCEAEEAPVDAAPPGSDISTIALADSCERDSTESTFRLDDGVTRIDIDRESGDGCDVDMFALQVPAGGAIEAAILTAGGDPCATAASSPGLALLGPDGVTLVGAGSPRGGNECPVIDATDAFAGNLDEGTYFLRLRAAKDRTAPLTHRLRLQIRQAPTAK